MQVPSDWAQAERGPTLGLGAPEQFTVYLEDGASLQEPNAPAGTTLVLGFENGATEAQVTWTGGVASSTSCFPVDANGNPGTCPGGIASTTLVLDGTPGVVTVTWDNHIAAFTQGAFYGSATINLPGAGFQPGGAAPAPPKGIKLPPTTKAGGTGPGGGAPPPPPATPASSTGTVVAVVAAAGAIGAGVWYFFLR
jgi:hypothetical protein